MMVYLTCSIIHVTSSEDRAELFSSNFPKNSFLSASPIFFLKVCEREREVERRGRGEVDIEKSERREGEERKRERRARERRERREERGERREEKGRGGRENTLKP